MQMRACANFALPCAELCGPVDSLWPVLVQCLVCLLGCDPAFCIVWFRFRMLRRYLACRPGEVPGVYRMIGGAAEHHPGTVLRISLLRVLQRLGFQWDPGVLGWERPGLPALSNLAGLIQHFRAAVLEPWRNKVSADLCTRQVSSLRAHRGSRPSTTPSRPLMHLLPQAMEGIVEGDVASAPVVTYAAPSTVRGTCGSSASCYPCDATTSD